MRLAHEGTEFAQAPVIGMDLRELGDVVAVIAKGRRIERQQPDCRHAKVGDVVELLGEPRKIAGAITGRVVEGLDVKLVDDRVLVPKGIVPKELRGGDIGTPRRAAHPAGLRSLCAGRYGSSQLAG